MLLDNSVLLVIVLALFYCRVSIGDDPSPLMTDYSQFGVMDMGRLNANASLANLSVISERQKKLVHSHTIVSSNRSYIDLYSTESPRFLHNFESTVPIFYDTPSAPPPTVSPRALKIVSPDNSSFTLPLFGIGAKNEYDYQNVVYPVPFDQLYHNKSMRYVKFGERDSRFSSCVEFGEVSDAAFLGVDYIAVTGSSTNHLYSNINTMYSILRADIRVSIVFVDFGLHEASLAALIREMSRMNDLYKSRGSSGKLYYRKFDFSHFPEWYDINDELQRGGYSWKVISYYDVLMESRRIVFWSDGGNELSLSIEKELNRTRMYGLFTPYSGGSLQQWTHPLSSGYLKSHKMIRKVMIGKGMCTGGYLFVNANNDHVMRDVVYPLIQCAYTRRCISPQGSHRKNHRQDQAILSALVHSAGINSSCGQQYNTKVRYHQECNSDETCANRREALVRDILKSV